MKNRKKLITIFLLVAIIICLPSIYAYMIRQANTPNQTDFVIGDTTCVINEEFVDNKKSSITIENKGNVEVYVRVKVLIYWEDSKGNPVGTMLNQNKNVPLPTLNFNKSNGLWMHDKDNDIYYYTQSIKPGVETQNLLASPMKLKSYSTTVDGITYEYFQVVEIHCESIQYRPISAVENSWGIDVDESSGVIIPIN